MNFPCFKLMDDFPRKIAASHTSEEIQLSGSVNLLMLLKRRGAVRGGSDDPALCTPDPKHVSNRD